MSDIPQARGLIPQHHPPCLHPAHFSIQLLALSLWASHTQVEDQINIPDYITIFNSTYYVLRELEIGAVSHRTSSLPSVVVLLGSVMVALI